MPTPIDHKDGSRGQRTRRFPIRRNRTSWTEKTSCFPWACRPCPSRVVADRRSSGTAARVPSSYPSLSAPSTDARPATDSSTAG